mmetsp:Transcript_5922/g.16927  ORF Transcript_5922/g.16927 Transcript_5922/m.16927 type:complete len:412 (+) Transcript_5922:2106-3341(+)
MDGPEAWHGGGLNSDGHGGGDDGGLPPHDGVPLGQAHQPHVVTPLHLDLRHLRRPHHPPRLGCEVTGLKRHQSPIVQRVQEPHFTLHLAWERNEVEGDFPTGHHDSVAVSEHQAIRVCQVQNDARPFEHGAVHAIWQSNHWKAHPHLDQAGAQPDLKLCGAQVSVHGAIQRSGSRLRQGNVLSGLCGWRLCWCRRGRLLQQSRLHARRKLGCPLPRALGVYPVPQLGWAMPLPVDVHDDGDGAAALGEGAVLEGDAGGGAQTGHHPAQVPQRGGLLVVHRHHQRLLRHQGTVQHEARLCHVHRSGCHCHVASLLVAEGVEDAACHLQKFAGRHIVQVLHFDVELHGNAGALNVQLDRAAHGSVQSLLQRQEGGEHRPVEAHQGIPRLHPPLRGAPRQNTVHHQHARPLLRP